MDYGVWAHQHRRNDKQINKCWNKLECIAYENVTSALPALTLMGVLTAKTTFDENESSEPKRIHGQKNEGE